MSDSINFTTVSALLLDPDRFNASLVAQMLRGFGISHQVLAATGEEIITQLSRQQFHLLITESRIPDMSLSALTQWIRHHEKQAIRFLPIVVLTSYTQPSIVAGARDAGVNCVVGKPVSPSTLLEHILWSARMERPFIEADHYSGPCRRFHTDSPVSAFSRRISDHPG
ncbi:CheY-like chemotaxis protein [Rhizomicrobium palustre]|uniref:CheY-like chemotaxis protein n=2 Tax=Bacteria TaxID=2 RepID=A0A846N184_9PROT|nr:response regulator [Rhizomicrobium palustre]NIK89249.1 CheY-like chemotaxis protein [Rhizomicrobium palustre]